MTDKLFREDLRKTFVFDTIYKDRKIEVYIIRHEYKVKVKRHNENKVSVHAVAYTTGRGRINEQGITYKEGDVVGFDSAHGWYSTQDDSEQYKHIGCVLNQAQNYIDEEQAVKE